MDLSEAQEILNDNGFPCGTPDGVYGPKTRAALQHFQNATTVDLHNAGGYDPKTIGALRWLPQLAKNFTVSEAQSQGNGNCYVRSELLNALEDLRANLGRPVSVHSMYRDRAHNQAVGGASRSLHMWGLAADVRSQVLAATFADVRDLNIFSGIGWVTSTGYVRHVDMRHLTGYHDDTPWDPAVWQYAN